MPKSREQTSERPTAKIRQGENRFVLVQAGPVNLEGNLYLAAEAQAAVVFVHGSGSSRLSPRNQYVAQSFQKAGMVTLLFDLLTPEEEEVDMHTRHLRFDISLLARRTIGAVDWLNQQAETRGLKLGFFGASTGAAAALIAATERPKAIGAVVSRGGRPDLASAVLPHVKAPVLYITGQLDHAIFELTKQALSQMNPEAKAELQIVPGATHLFEEPGAMETVSRLATGWFQKHLAGKDKPARQE